MNSRNQEANKKLLKKLVKRSIEEQAKYKNRQFIRRTLWVLASILIVFSLWLLAASFTPDTSSASCVDLQEEPTVETRIYKANPTKIIVQPWLGEHHVYALFSLPKRYGEAFNASSDVFVMVKGVSQPIPVTRANPSLYGFVDVNEDSFLMVAYLWTRETIWQILQGKYGELNNLCNWTLYIK
jgi:hypothetical protein